jgi:acyl dehydratase
MAGLALGELASIERTFTRADLLEYASLAGFPAPADQADAPGAHVVIPGPLLGALFSYLLGTRLPGPGTNYLKQRLAFPAPAYINSEITATVEIVGQRLEKDLVNLRTLCTDPEGRVVCEGEALVLVKDVSA